MNWSRITQAIDFSVLIHISLIKQKISLTKQKIGCSKGSNCVEMEKNVKKSVLTCLCSESPFNVPFNLPTGFKQAPVAQQIGA